jgi:hypothetical protein
MLTPGQYLSQFALSVDTIDDDAYHDVLRLLGDYLAETLGSSYYSAFIDGVRVDSDDGPLPGLRTFWSSREDDQTLRIFRGNGEYAGHLAYAYHRGRPLWITAPDRGGLSAASEYQDAWSGVEDLPPYRAPGDSSDERTSIVIPLRYGKRIFGAIDIEFDAYHEFSEEARDELLLLSGAFARVVWLHETTGSATRATVKALEALNDQFAGARSPLERPSFFVASPSQADEAAMEAALEVVRQYEDTFDINYWHEMAASGNINQQVADAITNCHLGVCYLSARRDGDGLEFVDNANVLFEAGMLYALKQQPGATPASWIVIRESEELGGPPPFDLASERMVIVPRNSEGELLRDDFKNALSVAINKSLGAV